MRDVDITLDASAFDLILNGTEMRTYLEEIAVRAIEMAKAIYESKSRHRGRGPVLYEESFFVRHEQLGNVPAVVIGNSDPESVFVEFGLSLGPSGRHVVRYRVFGSVLDALEGEGNG